MAKTRPESLPDEALVVAAILGDLHSFDALVMRYRSAAYRVAQSIAGGGMAEDAVQESLLLAYKALPSIEEPGKFAAWLYAITRHVALRMGRRTRQEASKRVELDDTILEHSDLARLAELDPNIKSVFEPLAEGSSLTTVAMACRQVVSYYENEVEVEEEGWRKGFAAGFKVPGCGGAVDFNVEELGNWIRDWMHEMGRRERERRAERKHCG